MPLPSFSQPDQVTPQERRGKQQLFYVAPSTDNPLRLEAVLIDEGVGPSNACVVHQEGQDIIAVANRETNEAALYFVE